MTCLSAFEWPEWDFGVLRSRVWDFVTDRERFLDFTLATDAGDFDDYLPGTAASTPCPYCAAAFFLRLSVELLVSRCSIAWAYLQMPCLRRLWPEANVYLYICIYSNSLNL